MKLNRSINWLCITLLCLALALAVILVTIPLLARGISQIVSDPLEPEDLDLRPIPVPVPAPPLAANQSPVSAIPARSLFAMPPMPEAVLVPTPPVSVMPSATSLTERQMPKPFIAVTIQLANRQDMIVITLVGILLLTLVRLHGVPSWHALIKENAC